MGNKIEKDRFTPAYKLPGVEYILPFISFVLSRDETAVVVISQLSNTFD